MFLTEFRKIPVKIAFYHALCNYAENKNISEKHKKNVYRKRIACSYNYFKTRYENVLRSVKYNAGEPVENAPIWIFWWQGEEDAPELVQLCIKSIRENSGKHVVHVVTKDNYAQFTNISSHIIQKLEDEIISLTHFSDVLRMNLLATNGGLWLDATIFCAKKIEDFVFEKPIYTGRNSRGDYKNISNWNWTIYGIAGWKHNTLFQVISKLLDVYWEENNYLVEYYMTDYFMKMAYDMIPGVKIDIESIEENNMEQMELCCMFNEIADETKYKEVVCNSTWLHKLTWKEQWDEKTVAGKQTMYSYWKEQAMKKHEIFHNCTSL